MIVFVFVGVVLVHKYFLRYAFSAHLLVLFWIFIIFKKHKFVLSLLFWFVATLTKDYWRLNLTFFQRIPVNFTEKGVTKQLVQVWTLFGVLVQHFLQTIFGFIAQVFRELKLSFFNIFIKNFHIVVVERRNSNKHLIEDNTYLVDVPTFGHTLLLEHLWWQVGWRAAETLGLEVLLSHSLLVLLGQTEISKADMTFFVDKQIFRLQISENDTLAMHVSHSENQLSREEF